MGNLPWEDKNELNELLKYCPAALNKLLVDIVDIVIVIITTTQNNRHKSIKGELP